MKNKLISAFRAVEILNENIECPMCGNRELGSCRRLMINEEIPGKEFVPFHMICECGYEVKVYE
jgi:C4-type Zn-finger protein